MSSDSNQNRTTLNADLARERQSATIDLKQMEDFLGELTYMSRAYYQENIKCRINKILNNCLAQKSCLLAQTYSDIHKKQGDEMVKKIKPLFYENFYNLDRDQKYQLVFKKSLEITEFVKDRNIEHLISMYLVGHILGPEKFLFSLHVTMFLDAIKVWSTPEQRDYFLDMMKNNAVFGTYVQTELGHGTYLRGLETTATYDKTMQEFVIDSPTLTSIKFWPGCAAYSCNYAIVMAKLVIDNQEHGIHAFLVQLRSFDTHKIMPGLELGDIGRKFGFDATDNAYLKFSKLRIPRIHMLMRFACVTPDGQFKRLASDVLMYAAMLLMRVAKIYLNKILTNKSEEQQIINYQTQQYRLFPSLAATYALSFAGWTFRKVLLSYQQSTNQFQNITPNVLGQLHAISSGLKSVAFGDCLKFAQQNRLCCGGHGYSASSGLGQIIQEADAGCTYEGDNVVLLLQTARYLLKCTQNGLSPHLEIMNKNELQTSSLYHKRFEHYFTIFYRLYEESVAELSSKMFRLLNEEKLAALDAWNKCSVQLIQVARVYIDVFVINSNLSCILSNKNAANQAALSDLFELYLLYEICDVYPGHILRFSIIEPEKLAQMRENLFDLLPKIRVNAVALVDAFGMLDSNLCSTLGAYDGNVYERLLDFAKQSLFNEKEVHDVYEKYLKPYSIRYKQKQRLSEQPKSKL